MAVMQEKIKPKVLAKSSAIQKNVTMKKKLAIILSLLLAASFPAFAIGTYYSTGMDFFYDTPLNSFDIGVYTNATWTVPVGNSGTGLGIGGRADVTLSLPVVDFATSCMFGIAVDTPVGRNAMFTFILGPSIASFSAKDDVLCLGGGIDAGMTFFANEVKSVGFTIGVNGNFFATIIPETPARFNFYGGGYFGVAMKFDKNTPYYPYRPYNIYIY